MANIFANTFDWMPVQGSTWAEQVDWINNFITYISVFCTVAITGAMVYFGIKYRRKTDNDPTPHITHNAALEIVWTAIPTAIVCFVFWYGLVIYREMRNPPSNAQEINVQAEKWQWTFAYNTGKKAVNELIVPVGQPVRLIMRSKDVNHSFFIPAMRVKEDVIGNQYNYLWFEANQTGQFPIFCTEYCGLGHSAMLANLRVVSKEAYQDFINDRAAGEEEKTPEALGKKLFAEKACASCHSTDGSVKPCPTLKGVFGHDVELTDGSKIKADENYLRESLLNPNAKIVKGFTPNVMPSQQGQLSDEQVDQLIAYIKTLQ
ncbi:cytochrome c oxidase subunit II [bacterium]|nr:cytochrome c oxidase subunit II [bacterium]